MDDIQKMLRAFGCNKFATGEDFVTGELYVSFEHRGIPIVMTASAKNYAAAWLKPHPWTSRTRASKKAHESKALRIGSIAIYSILRDWIKGQLTAIEIGIFSFEAAFLSHVMLPSGNNVLQELRSQKMLPAPEVEAEIVDA